jgi:DNA-binding winged helix-turn-helix (wHTH) protein
MKSRNQDTGVGNGRPRHMRGHRKPLIPQGQAVTGNRNRNCNNRAARARGAEPMYNDSIAIDRFVHEQRMPKPYLVATNEVSFVGVFKILTPQLLAFFRSRGCGPGASEALSQKVLYELRARVRAVLGSSSTPDPPEQVVIQIGNLKLDPERRLFWRGKEEIHLSPKEFDHLALMMKHSGVTLSHVKLLRSVWGLEYGGELEYLRTYVRMLEEDRKGPDQAPYIVNEPWIGHRFRNPEDRNPRRRQRRDGDA